MNARELNETYLLALAIYREARGETLGGKTAVAWVIRNRCEDSRWPDTYRDVILQPWQFSAFNKNDPNALVYPKSDDAAWAQCVAAAKNVMSENAYDFTNGANHYFAANIDTPNWAANAPLWGQWGNHKFYKL